MPLSMLCFALKPSTHPDHPPHTHAGPPTTSHGEAAYEPLRGQPRIEDEEDAPEASAVITLRIAS